MSSKSNRPVRGLPAPEPDIVAGSRSEALQRQQHENWQQQQALENAVSIGGGDSYLGTLEHGGIIDDTSNAVGVGHGVLEHGGIIDDTSSAVGVGHGVLEHGGIIDDTSNATGVGTGVLEHGGIIDDTQGWSPREKPVPAPDPATVGGRSENLFPATDEPMFTIDQPKAPEDVVKGVADTSSDSPWWMNAWNAIRWPGID